MLRINHRLVAILASINCWELAQCASSGKEGLSTVGP
jgi:hypothetical protein